MCELRFYGVSMGTKRGSLNHNPSPIVIIGAPKRGGGGGSDTSRLQPPPFHKRNIKIYRFCKQYITGWSRDLHFSLNQPMKSAEN
jgi:hypothetical protein